MSLVNQMLQDLEQRRAQAATPNGSPLAGLAPSAAATRGPSSLNALLLGAVLVLSVVSGYLLWTQRANSSITVEVVPSVAAPQQDDVAVYAPPAPVVGTMPEPVVVAEKSAPVAQAIVAAPAIEKLAEPVVVAEKPAPVIEKKLPAPIMAKPAIEEKPVAGESSIQPQVAEPDEPQLMEKRARPLTAEQRAQQSFQQAVAHLNRGRQDEARSALMEAIEHDPAHLRARETLAALQINTGRTSEAEATLRAGLALDPTAAPLAKLEARLLLERGDANGAVAVLEPALPNAQTDADYLALLAATLSRANRHFEAAQAYERLLSLRPDAGPWWLGLALALEAQGNTAQALPAYEQARRNGLDAKVAVYVDGRIAALKSAAGEK